MRVEDRLKLKEWEAFHRAFAQSVDADTHLTPAQIERKRKELEAHPVEWIRYFFPKYAEYDFAPFHVKAIHRIIANDEWYEVLSWSRELAKSTVAMFIILFIMLTGKKRFLILASATIDAAERLLLPYKINLESNARILQFYGKQENLGSWTNREFTTRSGCKFMAIGAGSAPRGARTENIRPDVLYMDDFDTDEECRNPVILQKKWEWFEEALYPTRSVSKATLILWCGNIIAKDCCIVRAGKIANHWDIVNIRDKHGKSTWAAKNTEEHIDRTLSKISQKAIQGEYYNNPVAEGKIFKNLPYGKVPPLSKFKFLIAYGDPAYSDSKSKASSTKSLWLVGKYQGTYYVIKGFLARVLNAEFIEWYFQLKEYVGSKATVYFYMENNKLQDPFFQQVFKPLLQEECKRRNTELYIREDSKKKTDKATRIEANLEPLDRNCQLVFNEKEKDNPMMEDLREQFKLFEMTLPYPADGPDSIEGAVRVIGEKVIEAEPVITLGYDEYNRSNPFKI